MQRSDRAVARGDLENYPAESTLDEPGQLHAPERNTPATDAGQPLAPEIIIPADAPESRTGVGFSLDNQAYSPLSPDSASSSRDQLDSIIEEGFVSIERDYSDRGKSPSPAPRSPNPILAGFSSSIAGFSSSLDAIGAFDKETYIKIFDSGPVEPNMADRFLAYLATFAAAIKDALGDILSLFQAGNKSIALLIIAGGTAFLSSFELSGRSAGINFRQVRELIYNKKWPSEVLKEGQTKPNLHRKQTVLVFAISLFIALWCALSEAIQAFSFTESISSDYGIARGERARRAWVFLAIAIAIGACLTRVFTDNYEAFLNTTIIVANSNNTNTAPDPIPTDVKTDQNTINIVTGERATRTSRSTKIASYVIAGPFGALKAVHDAVQAFSVIEAILNLRSITPRMLLALFCCTEIYAGFSFAGKAMMQQVVDAFEFSIAIYNKEKEIELPKVAATAASLSLAFFLAYVKRKLNSSYYPDLVNKDLGFLHLVILDEYYMMLSWLILVAEVMLTVASLNPQMMANFTSLNEKLQLAYKKFTQPKSIGDYPEATNSLISGLFANPSINDDDALLLQNDRSLYEQLVDESERVEPAISKAAQPAQSNDQSAPSDYDVEQGLASSSRFFTHRKNIVNNGNGIRVKSERKDAERTSLRTSSAPSVTSYGTINTF